GVERVDAVLATGRVGRRAQVEHGRRITQRHKPVPETLGEENRLAAVLIQTHRLPLPEARRPGTQVRHHIENSAADAGDVLGLARRDVRVVDPADHAAPGHRSLTLRDVEPVAQISGELATPERLEERSPVVLVHLRGEHPGALDTQRFHHSSLCPGGRRNWPTAVALTSMPRAGVSPAASAHLLATAHTLAVTAGRPAPGGSGPGSPGCSRHPAPGWSPLAAGVVHRVVLSSGIA